LLFGIKTSFKVNDVDIRVAVCPPVASCLQDAERDKGKKIAVFHLFIFLERNCKYYGAAWHGTLTG
jgi:competence transcription factor ComK